LVSDEVTNRYDLALKLAKLWGINDTKVKPGLSAQSGLNRPLNLSLDTTKWKASSKKTRLRGVTEYIEKEIGEMEKKAKGGD